MSNQLDFSIIYRTLQRAGILDFSPVDSMSISDTDYVQMFDTDMNIQDVIYSLYQFVPYRRLIDDVGDTFIVLKDTVLLGGCRVKVEVSFKIGPKGYGVFASAVTKKVTYVYKGTEKEFPNYKSLNSYLELVRGE